MGKTDEDLANVLLSLDRWPISPIENEEDGDGETQELAGAFSQSSKTYLVGFVIVNIVGLQYYSGTISGREMVGLVREPLNPYDGNAIKAISVGGLHLILDIDASFTLSEAVAVKEKKSKDDKSVDGNSRMAL
ncbi:hypothetical protein F0562_010388 [Nyssa sinensis]|uniref:HIRAN domain-containing protein n=1 Tax=Nyssa sinensis TaxID=561372 RepID=A0A5J5A405_9ASTE|nr:hypothetical protein F0562_010388 [Nyssa sinensis]